ncbi:unnamed protein product [Rotaria sp. Silwood2]|nr:unnamed protein product [Rotaria sp. Silwood2]CAF4061850.1 unnamed protein product [Rotaria sp. Silwood2]
MQRDKTKSTTEIYHSISNKGISRDKPTVGLFSTKSSTIKQIIKCGQCEKDEAKMKCLECVENYCAKCFTHFHLRGALQRHHRVFLSENQLSISQKKKQLFKTSINLPELSYRQSNDDLNRISTTTLNIDTNIHKSKRTRQKHDLTSSITGTTVDKIEYFNRLPNIEFNSSKKYQHADKNNQKMFSQRSKRLNITKKTQPKIGVLVNIYYSLSDNIDLNEPSIDIEPFDEDLSVRQTAKSARTITPKENSNNVEQTEELERPITHISTVSNSRSTSSSIKKDSIPLRSNSIALFQQSLRSVLDTKSNDELQAIVNSQLILSRASSSTPEKLNQSSMLSSEHCIPEQHILNNKDVQSTVLNETSTSLSDLALDNLFNESKIKLASSLNYQSSIDSPIKPEKDQFSTHVFCTNSLTTTSRRSSPFSFTHSINKISRINSSSSIDTNDDGFFTNVLPQQTISSTRILQCSKSNEWTYVSENQSTEYDQTILNSVSLRKSSVESLVRTSSKHSIKIDETHYQSTTELDNNSRPESSLSSASLPVSITSSKTDFINRKIQSLAISLRKNSSASPLKSSSSSLRTTETSSSQLETRTSNIVESSKVTSPYNNNKSLQESINSLNDKSLSNVYTQESSNDLLKLNLITNLTEDENITVNDLPIKEKTTHRQTRTNDELSKFRKLEFSMGDGLKWHDASTESFSSNQSSHIKKFQLLTPSKSMNTKILQQFNTCDNNDGRSSHMDQNVNDDDECLNQLHQEHCSTC